MIFDNFDVKIKNIFNKNSPDVQQELDFIDTYIFNKENEPTIKDECPKHFKHIEFLTSSICFIFSINDTCIEYYQMTTEDNKDRRIYFHTDEFTTYFHFKPIWYENKLSFEFYRMICENTCEYNDKNHFTLQFDLENGVYNPRFADSENEAVLFILNEIDKKSDKEVKEMLNLIYDINLNQSHYNEKVIKLINHLLDIQNLYKEKNDHKLNFKNNN